MQYVSPICPRDNDVSVLQHDDRTGRAVVAVKRIINGDYEGGEVCTKLAWNPHVHELGVMGVQLRAIVGRGRVY